MKLLRFSARERVHVAEAVDEADVGQPELESESFVEHPEGWFHLSIPIPGHPAQSDQGFHDLGSGGVPGLRHRQVVREGGSIVSFGEVPLGECETHPTDLWVVDVGGDHRFHRLVGHGLEILVFELGDTCRWPRRVILDEEAGDDHYDAECSCEEQTSDEYPSPIAGPWLFSWIPTGSPRPPAPPPRGPTRRAQPSRCTR